MCLVNNFNKADIPNYDIDNEDDHPVVNVAPTRFTPNLAELFHLEY